MVPGNDVAADDTRSLALVVYSIGCKSIRSAETNAYSIESAAGSRVVNPRIRLVADEVVGNYIAVSVQHLDTIRFHRRASEIREAVVGDGIVHVFAEIESIAQLRAEPMNRLVAVGDDVVADPDAVMRAGC